MPETRSQILSTMGIEEWLWREENFSIDDGDIAERIANCQACGLANHSIPPLAGVGFEDASLLVIAEYAMASSDNTSQVLSEKSSMLFSAMMRGIRCKPEHIFITTTLKCASTEKPKNNEAEICRKHLVDQINTIQPKVILCLGALAAQTLLETKTTVSDLRKTAHEHDNIPVVVSYHPEYLLRQPSQKSAAWQDLRLLSHFL